MRPLVSSPNSSSMVKLEGREFTDIENKARARKKLSMVIREDIAVAIPLNSPVNI